MLPTLYKRSNSKFSCCADIVIRSQHEKSKVYKKWLFGKGDNTRSEMEKEVVAARQLKTHPDHQDVYQPKTQTAEARNQAACVIL